MKKATLYITAHGLYDAIINGRRATYDYFTPGRTPYDKRLLYQTYEVTHRLRPGTAPNEIVVTVGDGWYRGVYGKDASLLCKLVIEYQNGTQDSIISDGSWLNTTGPIRRSSIYFGEFYDANIIPQNWVPVKTDRTSQVNLQPYNCESVGKQERFLPKQILTSPKGETILDFGQNIAGWVQIHVTGHKGDTIRITHAEVLDKNGNLFLSNRLYGNAVDTYILSGNGEESLEPHFTYHGFRYARVEGFTPTKINCTAIAIHSKLQHSGTFYCSNELLNQLQHNIEWSLNGNLFDILTDCPQRGSQMGGAGDAQVIFRTAAFNRDLRLFFDKWLYDLALGDAATMVPMDYFSVYGDTALLRRQYPSMKAWAKYELGRTDPSTSQTDSAYLDQAFMIHSIDLTLQAGEILQLRDPDAPALRESLQQCKNAYRKAFVTKEGLLNNNTQNAYVLALQFDLLPDSLRERAVTQLVKLIHENKDHLATGVLETPYLLHVLSNHGYTDLAYTLLMQETAPSWLYSVKQGATTIWERWDAIKPDGEFDSSSLNHYAYGAVGDWLYQSIAGIQPMAPGYKQIKIEPHPGGGLSWVKSSYESKYGTIASEWKIKDREFSMWVKIPQGTEAIIVVPGKGRVNVKEGTYEYKTILK